MPSHRSDGYCVPLPSPRRSRRPSRLLPPPAAERRLTAPPSSILRPPPDLPLNPPSPATLRTRNPKLLPAELSTPNPKLRFFRTSTFTASATHVAAGYAEVLSSSPPATSVVAVSSAVDHPGRCNGPGETMGVGQMLGLCCLGPLEAGPSHLQTLGARSPAASAYIFPSPLQFPSFPPLASFPELDPLPLHLPVRFLRRRLIDNFHLRGAFRGDGDGREAEGLRGRSRDGAATCADEERLSRRRRRRGRLPPRRRRSCSYRLRERRRARDGGGGATASASADGRDGRQPDRQLRTDRPLRSLSFLGLTLFDQAADGEEASSPSGSGEELAAAAGQPQPLLDQPVAWEELAAAAGQPQPLLDHPVAGAGPPQLLPNDERSVIDAVVPGPATAAMVAAEYIWCSGCLLQTASVRLVPDLHVCHCVRCHFSPAGMPYCEYCDAAHH